MSIKELSNHLAEIPGYVTAIMEMDIANYSAPQLDIKKELIKMLRENASRAEEALRKPNEEYEKIWKMIHGEKKLIEMPKINMLRTMTLSQLPHHRAQLGVYFRLLDISVPASYGPSADEN